MIIHGACQFITLLCHSIRPYKLNYFNAIDSIILVCLSCNPWCASLFCIYQIKSTTIQSVIELLIVGIPHAALMLYILYFILKKTKILLCLKRKYQHLLSMFCLKKTSLVEANSDDGGHDTDSLPDRLVNPNEYEPLIPAVNHQGTENLQSD